MTAAGTAARRSGAPGDPRVARTRAHVLEQARALLAERGPDGLTLTELAAVARVSRQTLYRYWGTPADLVADLLLQRVLLPGAPAADAREALSQHLDGVRAALTDPAVSAAYSLLIAAADRSPSAGAALATVVTGRRAQLNTTLDGLARPLDEDEYGLLCGPVVLTHFVTRRPVTDAVIALAVQAVLTRISTARIS